MNIKKHCDSTIFCTKYGCIAVTDIEMDELYNTI